LSEVKKFDLNVEKILEDWDTYHAIREVIANALDEQLLTNSSDIAISKDRQGKWHVRDYGRGLRYAHLTQNENAEKLANPHVIGKFGIGLKDALATFDRKGVKVTMRSPHGDMTLERSQKHGFEDLVTLHVCVMPPSDPSLVGTDIVLDVSDDDISKAKDLFVKFSGERVIEDTKYGQVLENKGTAARVYINGVKASEEEKFLFSYNITSLTDVLRKALNRERSNVGRTAYTSRVKSILISCNSKEIGASLVEDLKRFSTGEMHNELEWIDVQEHAVKISSAKERVVFLTSDEISSATNMVDQARKAGYSIVAIPTNLREKIRGSLDVSGKPIRDLSQFTQEYNESFNFKFVTPNQLSSSEKTVYDCTDQILRLVGGRPNIVHEVKISETMRSEIGSFVETEGLWEKTKHRIIIKRSSLRNIAAYAGTLLHEVAHATSDKADVNRDFETELTKFLGSVSSTAISSRE
jgi:hypothetical protein